MGAKEYDCISYYNLLFKIEGFQARLEYELNITRQHAFSSYIAPHLDPKKLRNVTIDKFWPTGKQAAGDTKKIPDAKRERIAKALKANAKIRN